MDDFALRRRLSDDQVATAAVYRRQFFKTALCRFFTEGRCAKGDLCEHAHWESELLAKPVLSRTRMCKTFLRHGVCHSGDICPYAHDAFEVAKTNSFFKSKMCEFASREGGCKVGEACRYAHSPDELINPLCKINTVPPSVDFDDSPDTGYPLRRGGSAASTFSSASSLVALVTAPEIVLRMQQHDHLSESYYD